MREIRLSGSEGGGPKPIASPYPYLTSKWPRRPEYVGRGRWSVSQDYSREIPQECSTLSPFRASCCGALEGPGVVSADKECNQRIIEVFRRKFRRRRREFRRFEGYWINIVQPSLLERTLPFLSNPLRASGLTTPKQIENV